MIPRAVLGDGMHLSGGQAAYGSKPAILKIGNPAVRRNPNSAFGVLKKRLEAVIWQFKIGYLAHPLACRAVLSGLLFLFDPIAPLAFACGKS